MTEERLNTIEAKIAYQEDLLDVLNKIVYEQQQKLQQLEARCAALTGSMSSLAQAVQQNSAVNEERPPHY